MQPLPSAPPGGLLPGSRLLGWWWSARETPPPASTMLRLTCESRQPSGSDTINYFSNLI